MTEAQERREPVNVMRDPGAYRNFYELLGQKYPETEIVHGAAPWRAKAVLKAIEPYARCRAYMLDVGCNDGVYTIPYCSIGGHALGIDVSPTLVARARTKADGLDAEFLAADIEELPLRRSIFDLVLFSEVLEHLPRPHVAVRNIVSSLKPGGHLVLTTPNVLSTVRQSPRYLPRLFLNVLRFQLTEEYTDLTDLRLIGSRYGIHGYAYRHDSYYPLALWMWLREFGLRGVVARTNGSRVPLIGPSILLIMKKPAP